MGVIEGFDIQIVGVAAPLMAKALELDPTDLSWVFFASNAGMLAGAVAGGVIADRRGRRPVLVASALIFGVFTFAAAFSFGASDLIAFRMLAGIGLGAALPNLVATAADIVTPDRRGLVTGLIFCGVPLGGATVATLLQVLPPQLDWRTLFAVGGVMPLMIAGLQWRYLPETRPVAAPASDRLPLAQALFGEGRTLPTALLWAATIPILMSLYLVLYWLPTLIIQKGLPVATAAQASAAFNLAGAVGAIVIGMAADRFPRTYVLAIAGLLFVGVALLLAPASGTKLVLGLSAAAGFLLLGLNYAVYGLSTFVYPDSARASGSGATVSAGRIGSIVGPLIPGFLLAGGATSAAVLSMLAPAMAAASLAVMLLGLVLSRIRPRA
jgi:AAHS family 3-hydroxyphenylpropionic acid transporter